MVIALFFEDQATGPWEDRKPVMVLCDNTTGVPRVGTVLSEHVYLADCVLFQKKCLEHSIPWADFHQFGIRVNWSAQDHVQADPSGHSIVVTGTSHAIQASLKTHQGDA